MTLKLYLQQRGLARTHKGGVGSYLLFVMVLSFLQQHKVSYSKTLQSKTGLGHLLYDFFQLYGVDFCYEQTAISVNGNGSYFPKKSRSWYYPERPWELAVESPLDTSFDLGKSSYNIRVVRSCFRQSWMDLAELHRSWRVPSNHKPILQSIIFPGDPLFLRTKVSMSPCMAIAAVRPIPQLSKEVVDSIEKSMGCSREGRRSSRPETRKIKRRADEMEGVTY